MSAGLGSHGAVFQLLVQVRQEVRGNHSDLAGQALGLNTGDRAQQGVSAAARDDQRIDVGIGVDDGFGSLAAGIGRGAAVLRLKQLDLVVGIRGIPLFHAGLVAFPAAQERRVAGFPAFQADLAAALVAQNGHQGLAVVKLGFMHSAHIVLGSLRRGVFVGVGFLVDDAEELGNINFVIGAGLDDGAHLSGSGVADDDAVAVRHRQGFGGSGNLLGNMSLVDPLYFNIQGIGSRVDQTLAFAAERISGTPDGNTDLDFAVRVRGSHQAAQHRQSKHESKDLFHGIYPPYFFTH